jgi:hypothetical protein
MTKGILGSMPIDGNLLILLATDDMGQCPMIDGGMTLQ